MDQDARPAAGPTRDRWIALAAVGTAALLAAGWITRERQLATDLAESREDLRQAMHRLQTLSASTDQIRTAYLQRRSELDAAKKKIDLLAQRQEEKKRETSDPSGKKKDRETGVSKSSADPAQLFATIRALPLPAWTAVQKSEGAVRILPGVAAPAGNEGWRLSVGWPASWLRPIWRWAWNSRPARSRVPAPSKPRKTGPGG